MKLFTLCRAKHKTRSGVYILGLSLFFSVNSFAQPANDACGASQLIASATGLCNSVAGGLRNGAVGATPQRESLHFVEMPLLLMFGTGLLPKAPIQPLH